LKNSGSDQKSPAAHESAGEPTSRVNPFWSFRKQPASGGGEFLVPERLSQSTATTVPVDWCILFQEARVVVVVARSRKLRLKTVRGMAPTLADWTMDYELQDLLDRCSSSDDADQIEVANLDSRRRRKRVAVADFVDQIMAVRLGLAVETVRTYRRRPASAI
jgi:hypothetical protein